MVFSPSTEKISPILAPTKQASSNFFQTNEANPSETGQMMRYSKDCCITEINSSTYTINLLCSELD